MMRAEEMSPTACRRRARLTGEKSRTIGRQDPQFRLHGVNSHPQRHTDGTPGHFATTAHLLQGQHARSKQSIRKTCCLRQSVTSRSQLTGCETNTTRYRSTATFQQVLCVISPGSEAQSDVVTPTQGKSRELKTVARAHPRVFFNSLTVA